MDETSVNMEFGRDANNRFSWANMSWFQHTIESKIQILSFKFIKFDPGTSQKKIDSSYNEVVQFHFP